MNSTRHCARVDPRADPRGAAGFTLIELLVVMGILAGFLVMLVQLVDSGLRMFGEGELGQALADRQAHAQRTITAELQALRGSPTGRDRDVVDDRLVVQMLPIGLPAMPERGATRVQVLRGAVRLSPDRELGLVNAMLTARVLRDEPNLSPNAIEQKVQALAAAEPLRGIGSLLLVPWRTEGDDEALLELRAGWFLPGQLVPLGQDRFIDPFKVAVPGGPDLPSLVVQAITMPILQDLLHVEYQLWSQTTRGWRDPGETVAGGAGPERIWDSARGGWLVDEPSGGQFSFDRGGASENDGRDDIHPHAILVRCVVAQPPEYAPEGRIVDMLAADAQALLLYDGNRFPGPAEGGWIKLRGEWISYSERSGDELRGLRRGRRDTKALEHPAGTRVHIGRTVEFVLPIAHQKDDWNG